MSSTDCLGKCSKDCISVLDTANTKHQLRTKESLYITWLTLVLNKQKQLHHFLSKFIFFCSFSLTHLILPFD